MIDYKHHPLQSMTATFTHDEQLHALQLLEALADKLEVPHAHPFRGFIDAIRRAQPKHGPYAKLLAWHAIDEAHRRFVTRNDAWIELRDDSMGILETGSGESFDEAVQEALRRFNERAHELYPVTP